MFDTPIGDCLTIIIYYEWCKPPPIAELAINVVEARELIKADAFGNTSYKLR